MTKGKINNRYTPDFKRKVVRSVLQNGLSYREAARMFDIRGSHCIQDWERIYLEEGPEALSVERRGRTGKIPREPRIRHAKNEDLLQELHRLRVENAYLKKLLSLLSDKEHSPSGKCPPFRKLNQILLPYCRKNPYCLLRSMPLPCRQKQELPH